MSKVEFKVEDRVKAIGESYGWGKVNKGDEGVIKHINGKHILVDFPAQVNWMAEKGDLELVTSKLTKKQRITALEEQVDVLEGKLEKESQRNTVLELEVAELKTELNLIVEQLRGNDGFAKKVVEEVTKEETKAKTTNQLRAEIIEKAKEFVEVKSECVKDSYRVTGGYKRKEKENPNYCGLVMKVEFEVYNQWKVEALCKYLDGELVTKGVALFSPSDVFNEHIGKAIALGRALGLDVSEFEQAVQPNEVEIGHTIRYYKNGVARFKHNVTRDTEIETVNRDLVKADKDGYTCTIINDTDAQY